MWHVDCKRMFIAYKVPHMVVSSSTLGRWVRIVLQGSGVTGYGEHLIEVLQHHLHYWLDYHYMQF